MKSDTANSLPHNEKNSSGTLFELMGATVEKLGELAFSHPVLEEKFELDGTTVVLVSKRSIGYAGGGINVTENADGKMAVKTPAGSGAKIDTIPLAVLVIKDGDVKVIGIPGENKQSVVAGILSTVIEKIKISKQKSAEK